MSMGAFVSTLHRPHALQTSAGARFHVTTTYATPTLFKRARGTRFHVTTTYATPTLFKRAWGAHFHVTTTYATPTLFKRAWALVFTYIIDITISRPAHHVSGRARCAREVKKLTYMVI
jgi:hypothetical protein